nr:hypothetical protein [Tanacetum cinerariifolium]
MMAKLSDSEDIQCAGFDHDHYQEAAYAYHEEHMMHDCVQLDHVVDSHDEYTHDSNIIMCDQYVRDNEVSVVHSGASSVPTDAFMMIYDDMCEPHDQSVSYPSQNTVVKNSLTAELAIYKEHVELDLHSIKLQLASTIKHNKSMVEEVSFLKKDFKQKENKYLADFLNIKTLKEKIKDKLIKQDQSLQIIHMLCKPRPNSNGLKRVAIGYKNPLCLTRAKQAQPALYNGHEIIKENHIQAIVHNSEDTLEIAEITRKKMNDKMNDPKCVTHKDNFEGIQNALTKEVKEMKDVFEELEAEVAQHAVVRKHDAIELKNLLIANDNLIAECLSQEVFCVATNSELNVARFTDMHVANTTAETRCLALEAELANLRETNNQDNQMELITHFSKLETTDSQITKLTDQVTHLQAQNDLFRAKNEKAKQHYTELYDSIKIIRAKHIEQVTKVTTENMNLKIGVSKATVNPLVSARDKHAIDVEPIVPRLRNNRNAHLDYLRHLKESVEMIRDIIEEAKVINVPVPPSTGVDCCPIASRSQPMSHVKPNTISPAKGDTKLPIDDKPRKNKSHL